MNDYGGLAEHLAHRKMGVAGHSKSTPLPKFLRSAKGRDAARAVVNNIVMTQRINPAMAPAMPTHQEIMNGLLAQMNSEGMNG